MERETKRNAIDLEMAEGISAALDRLDDDDQLWVAVITGTDSVFSAGSDLTSGGGAKTERGGEYGLIRRQRAKNPEPHPARPSAPESRPSAG
jgi:enoyl-CoA hydratase/carnithine racemase